MGVRQATGSQGPRQKEDRFIRNQTKQERQEQAGLEPGRQAEQTRWRAVHITEDNLGVNCEEPGLK